MKLKKPAILALAAMVNLTSAPTVRASQHDSLVAGVLAGTAVIAGLAFYKSLRNDVEIKGVKAQATSDRNIAIDGIKDTKKALNARIDALLKELRTKTKQDNEEPGAATMEIAAEVSPEPLVTIRIIMVENTTGEDVTLKNMVPMGSTEEKFTWLIPPSKDPQPVILGARMSTDQLFAVDKDNKMLTLDVDHETKSKLVISPAS